MELCGDSIESWNRGSKIFIFCDVKLPHLKLRRDVKDVEDEMHVVIPEVRMEESY